MEIKRRDFIKLFGGAAGTVALSSYGISQVLNVPHSLIEKAKNGPGIETWKSTVCRLCPGGCGVKVRLIDEVPVGIKGNPAYPVNMGGMCPLGHSSLEQLYSPERIKGPMKRTGLRGRGNWESISWDEALKIISERLSGLKSNDNSKGLAFLGYDEQNLMRRHIASFMKAFGSNNYFRFSSQQNDFVPFKLTQGTTQIPVYDVANAKYILNFGSNFLEEGYSPVYYTKLYSQLRASSKEGRRRIVHVDSRMNLTAANADRWIPIRPGTYDTLALGIAFVLIKDELYDKDFVNNHTFGFEDWTDADGINHLGYKSMVLGNYYPERVTDITSVPSETILEIARDLGSTQPAFVIGNQAAVENINGTFSQMAIHCLNALLGNFEKKGGVFSMDILPDTPEYHEEGLAFADGHKSIAHPLGFEFPLSEFSIDSFTKNILADKPYPLDSLFIYNGNPLFRVINHHEFTEALKKIPFIVSFDSFFNETSQYCDLILPDHVYLEKWDEASAIPSVWIDYAGIQQPVAEPFYDTRHTGDVLIDLANRIGLSGEITKFSTYLDIIKNNMEKKYESGQGSIISENAGRAWQNYLRERGWQVGRYNSFDEFWALILDKGGWINPTRKKKELSEVFKTPSGKFEFYSQTLKQTIDKLVAMQPESDSSQNLELVLNSLKITARGDAIYLPHHEPVPHDDSYPLYLTTFQLLSNRDGNASNLPMMQEMFGYQVRKYWTSWVEINPVTAAEYGINDNDWVWIESSIGTIKTQAKVHPVIAPSVLGVPFGMGHTSYGKFADNHGVNPNSILKNNYDMLSGKPALHATKVKIKKAT